jgi:bacteriocin-like protein
MEWTQDKVNEVELAIKKRAAAEPDFRALALSNPNAAIRMVTDLPVPTGYTVKFIENAGANHTIVLPDLVPDVQELSDSELAQVAGGNRNNVVL